MHRIAQEAAYGGGRAGTAVDEAAAAARAAAVDEAAAAARAAAMDEAASLPYPLLWAACSIIAVPVMGGAAVVEPQ